MPEAQTKAPIRRTRMRARALARLRQLRLRAVYVARRLRVRPELSPLAHGVSARRKAIEHCLGRTDALEVREIEASAERSALEDVDRDDPVVQDRLRELQSVLGALRAERALLDARTSAELRAYETTERLLWIRSARL